MATGVDVSEEVVTTFTAFKLKQGEYKLKYFIYKIEKNEIVIDKQGALDQTYDDFVADLPENDCRYAVIDVDFETADGRSTSKIVFITWNPDCARVRPKMMYSGSKEALKSALNGCSVHINATDYAELDFTDSILPVLRRF